uniref:Uncharacterized protein n=1 Tax=Periophthalmus magnuspinnatus TaxID=409849 RepID=A0A3B3ZZF0_9GOBI
MTSQWKSKLLCVLGKNVVHQLSVSLEEMYNGSTRKLALQKNVICEKCEGQSLQYLCLFII